MLSNVSKMTQLMTQQSKDSNPSLSDLKTRVLNLSSVLNNLKFLLREIHRGFVQLGSYLMTLPRKK